MAAITLEDMESKLLSLETLTRALEKTEPLSNERIDSETPVRFRIQPDWAHSLDSVASTDPVDVEMSVSGVTRRMTKEAALQAGANFGLTSAYAKKIPASYVEGLLNWHYSTGMGSNAYNVLSVGENVSAFTRPSLETYSNLELLDNVVSGIQNRHGKDATILADYKFANTLQSTDLRLIVPAHERHMVSTHMDDVPENGDDTWFSGIHLHNSLIGKDQTSLETYMFRYWCTNGATTENTAVGKWSRRQGSSEDVYEWARRSVDEILGGMESMFDQVQALATLNVDANTADVLQTIFNNYSVPVSQREAITNRLLGMPSPLTMYAIMQAITQAANESGMEDRRRDRLMRIGGALPTTTFDTLKAQVWREGHFADPTARNPYEPLVIA